MLEGKLADQRQFVLDQLADACGNSLRITLAAPFQASSDKYSCAVFPAGVSSSGYSYLSELSLKLQASAISRPR